MAKQHRTLDWLIQTYLPFLQKFGMNEENIRGYFETWKKGKEPAYVTDYMWTIFNQLLVEVAKQVKDKVSIYRLHADIYLQMSMFQRKYENKKGNHTLKQHFLNRLKHTEMESNLLMHVGIVSGHCCPFCDSLNNLSMSFKEALETQPLASSKCTREYGCNCTYTFKVLRDNNDRVIRKS